MNRATSNLFMVSSDSGIVSPVLTSAKIYPLILTTAAQENIAQLEVARLIRLAEISYGKREFDALELIARLLITTRHGQDAGIYYLALLENRRGHIESAQQMLEPLTRYASPVIKARAIWSYAAIHHKAGNIEEAVIGYLKASNAARNLDPRTLYGVSLQLSLIKNQEGDHHGALDVLEQAWPLVKFVSQQHPFIFYHFQNDVAYELAEIGQLEEASKHSAIACNSPFAEKYPEWKETHQGIKQKQQASQHRSVIIIIERKTEPELKPVVAIPVPVICFHSPKSYKINLRGSIYLTRAPASTLQLERIKYSITRRGPPQFHTP